MSKVSFILLLFLTLNVTLVCAQTKPLTNDDIVQMVKGGFDDQTIIKAIWANQPNFDTSVNALVALKTVGVSKPVIDAILEAEAKKKNPAPVVVPVTAPGPIKDPGLPEEVGVYAMVKGKLVEVEPEIVGWRTGGVGKAMMGFSHGHVNGNIHGPESRLRLTTPVEVIIRCPEGTAVSEYQLLRLDKKGDRREFRAMTGGRPADKSPNKSSAGLTNSMWNDIRTDELNELMDEIDALELRPDETELERWLENQFS